jgi:hypothetical protein
MNRNVQREPAVPAEFSVVRDQSSATSDRLAVTADNWLVITDYWLPLTDYFINAGRPKHTHPESDS